MTKVMPSIDISSGKAVKRVKGVKGSGVVVGNVVKVAEEIYNEGYDSIHIVDLDAAEGMGSNIDVVKDIAKIGFDWVQVGGGIRSVDRAKDILSAGASAVVVSTIFFENRKVFEDLVESIGGEKVLVSIDYRSDGYVYTRGWRKRICTVYRALEDLQKYSVRGAVFTFIDTEGTLGGVDRGVVEYVKMVNGLKEYAGGVSSYEDLVFLRDVGFDYVIIGMAFYSGILKGVKYV
jgi:phosphoribosylformimino-5-aminoimidazole carboxamide ribotide isomerase